MQPSGMPGPDDPSGRDRILIAHVRARSPRRFQAIAGAVTACTVAVLVAADPALIAYAAVGIALGVARSIGGDLFVTPEQGLTATAAFGDLRTRRPQCPFLGGGFAEAGG